jgi:geranylgeranyl diphosphate synthase type II
MIGGQTADIEAETMDTIDTKRLLYIHENKTAALIQSSMMIGAILAGAGESEVERIEKCAYNIGIAFQIQDDILDVIGTMEELGKPIGSDEKNNKQTYVTLNGLETSKQHVKELSEEAIGILDSFGGDNVFLKELVLSLINRSK